MKKPLKFLASKPGIILTGAVIGILAPVLAFLHNRTILANHQPCTARCACRSFGLSGPVLLTNAL